MAGSNQFAMRAAQCCLVSAVFTGVAAGGTVTYLTREAWQSAVNGFITEDFSSPTGASPVLDYPLLALTSTGQSSESSSAHPRVKHVDTSYIDLFTSADGENYVGSVGRTALSTTTTTYTNSEWCLNGDCTQGVEQQTTEWSSYSDVRSLRMDFVTPTLGFGFDYIATLSGSSPNRVNRDFRMALSFIDGTTSRVWVGGGLDFAPYEEGFMGVISNKFITSVTIRAADRQTGSTESIAGGDWTFQFSRKKKGDFYTYSLTDTISADQSSALLLSNVSVATPEPPPAVCVAAAGLLLAAIGRIRRRSLRR